MEITFKGKGWNTELVFRFSRPGGGGMDMGSVSALRNITSCPSDKIKIAASHSTDVLGGGGMKPMNS